MAFYKCRNCYEKYRGKQLFTLHVKHEHTEEVQKMCFVCLKMNSSIGNLFRHCRKEKHFACNRCSGRPRTFYRLLVHYITNHCECVDPKEHQMYECFECQRKERDAEIIVEHWYRTHGSIHIGRFFCLR
ncbi:unnamed protein product [Hymenolepis diminuta]|uniref:C2H2-type domain-containing protein n=1 Tax=Hymenolepis diminuta TaxID=6216 RepID=A0A564ZAZ4_HYMDI|nr:unnamed protein product [Hymenolepis diminuta]